MARDRKGQPVDLALERGLPVNLDAERFVLGSVLLDDSLYVVAAGIVTVDDFSLQKNRLIWLRMGDLNAQEKPIDRATLANELLKYNQLEACDGLTYLASLDDGLPRTSNIEAYCRMVKEKAQLRRIIFTGQRLIDRALMGEEDPEALLALASTDFLRLADPEDSRLLTPGQVVERQPGGINSLFTGPTGGLRTSFIRFDQLTGGLQPGDFILIAGRPSMGKTAFALNIADYVAVNLGGVVALFSLEMSQMSVLRRLLSARARVDSGRWRAGVLNAEERRRIQAAMAAMANRKLYIDDSSGITLADVHSRLRRLKAAEGLDLAIIDYLQLMSSANLSENRNQELGAISRGMKLMAKDLQAPVIGLSQLSRRCEERTGDKRPQLSDLRDSGTLEQDADAVAFIFREEVYKPDREDLRGFAELILAKQRNGPTGKVQLIFLRQWTKFENRAADLPPEGEAEPREAGEGAPWT